jgi:NADPH2:quinone reductase
MRAIQIVQPGGPEALIEVDIPTPVPGAGEIRVKAEVIGIGRPDVLVRKGVYKWMPPLPAIPGSEMVGVVDALGDGVKTQLLGQRVLVSARELTMRGGCYAEFICVPASAVYVLPDTLDPVDAASLPNLQFVNALWTCNGERPVHSILIPGVAGGVGSTLAQFARMKGVQVIGSTSTPEKEQFALGNGVDALVKGDSQSLPPQVMQVTGGRGVDLAIDQLGGDTLIACLRSLAPMGMVVSINVVTGMPAQDVFKEMRALLSRSPALRTFSMHTLDEDVTVRRGLMQAAIEQMASGQVKAPTAQVLALSQIQQAHAWLDAGASRGKLVIRL